MKPTIRRIALSVLATGCSLVVDRPPDRDGDGWIAAADCDDDAAWVRPDAVEVCNGVDDDCDGFIDDYDVAADPVAWFPDADGDSLGGQDGSVETCEAPGGFVANNLDCDDTDHLVGLGETWYADADGDGRGDATRAAVACAAPEGRVADATDCDDGNPEIGAPDAFYADGDGDGFGDPDAASLACDQPEGTTSDPSDCDDGDAAIHPDAEEVCNDGRDNDCDGDLVSCVGSMEESGVRIVGEPMGEEDGAVYSGFGKFASVGDVDGDGNLDLMVGAPTGAEKAGRAYVYWGPLGFEDGDEVDAADADTIVSGMDGHEAALLNVHALEDVDGDGCNEFALAATGYSLGATQNGAVMVFDGCTLGRSVEAADATLTLLGARQYDYLGGYVGPGGDLNSDGTQDLLTGGAGIDRDEDFTGAIYVVAGGTSASLTLGADHPQVYGEALKDRLGTSALGGHDFNDDGVDDLLVGGPHLDNEAGRLMVLLGPVTAATAASDADFVLSGSGMLSYALSAGDAGSTVLVGAPEADFDGKPGVGLVYVLDVGTLVGDDDIDNVADARLVGATEGGWFGATLGGPTDATGDGSRDALVGALGGGYTTAGQAFLFEDLFEDAHTGTYAADAAEVRIEGESPGDRFGHVVGLGGPLGAVAAESGLSSFFVGAPEAREGRGVVSYFPILTE